MKMTSVRRSSRGVKTSKKYKEFNSDDEDGKLAMFEESGSDFEDDFKKQNNNVKHPKVVLSSSDGSSGEILWLSKYF